MSKPKPGKYHKVCQDLPNAGFFDAESRKSDELIQKRMQEIISGNPEKDLPPEPRHASHLMARVAACREAKDEIKATLKACNIELEAYTRLMADQYEAEGITSLTLDHIGSVRLQEEIYVSTENPAEIQKWAMADEDLKRKVTLPSPTLTAVCKALILQGIHVPGVKLYRKLKAVYTSADGKSSGGDDE